MKLKMLQRLSLIMRTLQSILRPQRGKLRRSDHIPSKTGLAKPELRRNRKPDGPITIRKKEMK